MNYSQAIATYMLLFVFGGHLTLKKQLKYCFSSFRQLICCSYHQNATYMFTMTSLLQQIKARRLALGFKQTDMPLRIGVSRQQYQRLEAKGNPRLDTLELIAKGLNSEILLIPNEKLSAVMAILSDDLGGHQQRTKTGGEKKSIADDPWEGLLGDES